MLKTPPSILELLTMNEQLFRPSFELHNLKHDDAVFDVCIIAFAFIAASMFDNVKNSRSKNDYFDK